MEHSHVYYLFTSFLGHFVIARFACYILKYWYTQDTYEYIDIILTLHHLFTLYSKHYYIKKSLQDQRSH